MLYRTKTEFKETMLNSYGSAAMSYLSGVIKMYEVKTPRCIYLIRSDDIGWKAYTSTDVGSDIKVALTSDGYGSNGLTSTGLMFMSRRVFVFTNTAEGETSVCLKSRLGPRGGDCPPELALFAYNETSGLGQTIMGWNGPYELKMDKNIF